MLNNNSTANNHYAGFGPMTTKLIADMLHLENKIKPFPIADHKIHFSLGRTNEDKHDFKIYKQISSKTD